MSPCRLAKAAGAEVTGVCRADKLDLVRDLGADHVVDPTSRYSRAATRPLADLRRVLTPKGRLVIVGGETGGRWLSGADRQAQLLSPFVGRRLGSFITSENAEDLTTLAQL